MMELRGATSIERQPGGVGKGVDCRIPMNHRPDGS
jgi:hypothetical protein